MRKVRPHQDGIILYYANKCNNDLPIYKALHHNPTASISIISLHFPTLAVVVVQKQILFPLASNEGIDLRESQSYFSARLLTTACANVELFGSQLISRPGPFYLSGKYTTRIVDSVHESLWYWRSIYRPTSVSCPTQYSHGNTYPSSINAIKQKPTQRKIVVTLKTEDIIVNKERLIEILQGRRGLIQVACKVSNGMSILIHVKHWFPDYFQIIFMVRISV